jgi:hypothetical protein
LSSTATPPLDEATHDLQVAFLARRTERP